MQTRRVTRSAARRAQEEQRERERQETEQQENEASERDEDAKAAPRSGSKDERRFCAGIGELFGFVLIVGVALGVYSATSYRGLAGGDTGELVVAAYELGTAHPPGYPLWTLVGHAFERLLRPFVGGPTDVAWRVGLSSPLFNALAAGFTLLTVSRLTRGNWIVGLLVAGALFFSPLMWLYATHAEVFAMNNMFMAALLFAVVRWEQSWTDSSSPSSSDEQRPRALGSLYAGAFLCGLGLTNQHTLVVAAAPAVLAVLVTGRRQVLSVRVLAGLAGWFLVGLLPYAYLVVSQHPLKMYSWGDMTTLRGFVVHLLRSEYGTLSLHKSFASEPLSTRLLLYAQQLSSATYYAGIPLAVVGAAVTVKRARTSGTAYLAGMLLYLGGFLALCNMPTSEPLPRGILLRFFMQPHIVAFVWIGVAVDALLDGYAPACRRPRSARQQVLLFAVVAALLALQVSQHYTEQDWSGSRFLDDFGPALLRTLPDGAVLLVSGDFHINSVQYAQRCQGVRPDVSVLSIEHMTYDWWAGHRHFYPNVTWPNKIYFPNHPDGFSMHAFLSSNYERRPIYLLGHFRRDDPSTTKYGWTAVAAGLAERVLRPSDVAAFEAELHAREWDVPVPVDQLPSRHSKRPFPVDSWEAYLLDWYWGVYGSYAYSMIRFSLKQTGGSDSRQAQVAERAESLLRVLIANSTRTKDLPGYYLNLGLVSSDLLKRLQPSAANRRERSIGMLEAFRSYLRFQPDATDVQRYQTTKKNLRVWRDWLATNEGVSFVLDDDNDT